MPIRPGPLPACWQAASWPDAPPFPDRFESQMTLKVRHQKESLEEIHRCIGEGMVGLKLYTQVKLNDYNNILRKSGRHVP